MGVVVTNLAPFLFIGAALVVWRWMDGVHDEHERNR